MSSTTAFQLPLEAQTKLTIPPPPTPPAPPEAVWPEFTLVDVSPNTPVIDLRELPVNPLVVGRAVELSRRVLRVGGTRRDRPLHLLTTSSRRALVAVNSPLAVERWNADDLGVCWATRGVIWIATTTRFGDRVTPRTPHDMVTTLAHEVAHLLASGVHPEAWRRAFAVLLPLWLGRDPREDGTYHDALWHRAHSRAMVRRYSRNRRPPGAETAEIERSHRAACRAWELWCDHFDAGAMLTERT